MNEIILAAIGLLGSIDLGVVTYLLRKRSGHAMSQEERDLLHGLKGDVKHIRQTMDDQRDDVKEIIRRFNEHQVGHR